MPEIPTLPIAPIVDRQITPPVWLNWFNAVFRFIRLAPQIYKGVAAPTTTPTRIGDIFIDTNNTNVYISTGTSSSSDWTLLN